jgi:hypothetical protein
MTEVTFQDTLDSLEELLEQERTALINGNLDQIGEFLNRKEELVDQLNSSDIEQPDELAYLQRKVARNQALLDNALEGIRTVARRRQRFAISASRWIHMMHMANGKKSPLRLCRRLKNEPDRPVDSNPT